MWHKNVYHRQHRLMFTCDRALIVAAAAAVCMYYTMGESKRISYDDFDRPFSLLEKASHLSPPTPTSHSNTATTTAPPGAGEYWTPL